MAFDNGFSRGDEFMVGNLIEGSVLVLILAVEDAAVGESGKGDVDFTLVVDFIEGHPEFYLVFIALKADRGKADEEIHQLAVAPAAIFRYQMIGHFEVGESNYRFNAVFEHFVKEVIIEFQAFLIGLCFVPLGENPCPGDTGAEAFKAHFGK